MQNSEQLQELEEIGMDADGEELEIASAKQGASTSIAIFQTVLCVLAIVALVILKAAYPDTYDKVTQWYRQEASKEIELPSWNKNGMQEASSQAEEVSSPSVIQTDGGGLQKV